MPNVNAVLNEQIRRLARREIRSNTRTVKRATSHYRHDIALLKKQVTDLTKRLNFVEHRPPAEMTAAPEALERARFRAMGVKAHRAKLGLSAEDYGKLVGVSGLTIYHWESGKARPRNKQMTAKWLAIRGLGKREALRRLGVAEPSTGPGPLAAGQRRRRGKFKQTGEQTILSLLKEHRALTTSQVNAAWKKEGRGGTADVLLGLMVNARKLQRTKVPGQRGSEYRIRRG